MQTETRLIKRPESRKSKSGKPVVIKWHGVKMLRSQSINACVNEIYETTKSMGFVKINLIGASSSGKTVLSHVLAHQLHKLDSTFEVHHYKDEDLINFKATIKNLSSNNQILCFDDLSGLVANFGKIALDKLKADITTIRHINESEDRKTIMILNFHAQKTLDKFLRISDFTFYTDCKNEEIGYLEELLGKNIKRTILKFRDLRASSRMFHKFSFQLGRKDTFVYKDGDPFRVLLYNNSLTTRFVVSPQLEWILGDDICQTCNSAVKSASTKINLEEFFDDYTRKFTPNVAKRAVQIKLSELGKSTLPKRVQQAKRYIEMFLSRKEINLDELAEKFHLDEIRTIIQPSKQPKFLQEKN